MPKYIYQFPTGETTRTDYQFISFFSQRESDTIRAGSNQLWKTGSYLSTPIIQLTRYSC